MLGIEKHFLHTYKLYFVKELSNLFRADKSINSVCVCFYSHKATTVASLTQSSLTVPALWLPQSANSPKNLEYVISERLLFA